MKTNPVPETIQTIMVQAGGMGLRGAYVYVGGHELSYRCHEPEGECRSRYRSELQSEAGQSRVQFDVGVRFLVNGKRGRLWTMMVVLEPNDTYSVWLVDCHPSRRKSTIVLAHHEGIYCDTLQSVIESTYDEAIAKHNRGFISLS